MGIEVEVRNALDCRRNAEFSYTIAQSSHMFKNDRNPGDNSRMLQSRRFIAEIDGVTRIAHLDLIRGWFDARRGLTKQT
jgi:hypothetical protein